MITASGGSAWLGVAVDGDGVREARRRLTVARTDCYRTCARWELSQAAHQSCLTRVKRNERSKS